MATAIFYSFSKSKNFGYVTLAIDTKKKTFCIKDEANYKILDGNIELALGDIISVYKDKASEKMITLFKKVSDAWKKSPWNKPSCTVKENHGGVNLHPKLPRVLTPRELAALQSFPDDFIFQGSKKWQLVQIGNAVPCLLGKAIGIAVAKSLSQKDEK